MYKKIVIVNILVLLVCNINGQNFLKTKDDFKSFYWGGELQYGLIDDNHIYLSVSGFTNYSYIWTKQLISDRLPVIYKTGIWWPDGVWNKGGDMLSILFFFSSYQIFAVKPPFFEQKRDNCSDTIKSVSDEFCYNMFIHPYYNYRRALDKAFRLDREFFPSTFHLYNEERYVINMDMYSQNSDSMQFYMRDKKALYVYTITIDTITNIFDSTKEIDWSSKHERACWREDIVYTTMNSEKESPIYKYWTFYSGEKTQFNAITDSLFFEGNYKVIMQNDQTYLFNRKYGHIYLLTDTEVIRIGTIRLTDEYPAIKGHKYIIEDRDRGSILLFAPVDWHDDIHPKPTIEVLSEQEFYQRYKLEE